MPEAIGKIKDDGLEDILRALKQQKEIFEHTSNVLPEIQVAPAKSFKAEWLLAERKIRQLRGENLDLAEKLTRYERELMVPATFVLAVNRVLKRNGCKHRLKSKDIKTQKQLIQAFAELVWYTCPSDAEVYD
jgi:hypothetical protein